MRRLTESGINSVTYSKKLCVCPLLRGYQSGCEKAPEQLWPKMEMETTQPVEKGKGKGKRERVANREQGRVRPRLARPGEKAGNMVKIQRGLKGLREQGVAVRGQGA